ncbi:MAG: cytochrome c3 family protein, partial [Candidatus Hydrogenedentes bacterium]|nr:cytochrome c3 family protein [Candidatus Hydrogenedentota bacterium]
MNQTERFVHKCRGNVALGCVVLALVLAAGNATALQAKPDGSRAPVVHKMMLIDPEGYPISANDFYPNPMSTRMTCGTCHNYGRISHGTHFGAGMETADQQSAEPWILADELTGTQLPIGNKGWQPAEIGLSPWRFVKAFGSHMPGGGVGDTDHESPDVISQWQLSGNLEINCLACHAGSHQQDQSEWAVQVANENFAWAATAASGIGTVTGAIANLPEGYDLIDGPNLDYPDQSPPSIELNKSIFDSKNDVFIDISSKPSSDRCYFCHSSYVNGTEPWHTDEDVHMAAGLTCVDCHRNGIDHKISIEREDQTPAGLLSCKGCHLGQDNPKTIEEQGGRFGAPRPEHKGLPPIHLDKLTCTACHSGPRPAAKPVQVLTARANRLGAHRETQDYSNVPY